MADNGGVLIFAHSSPCRECTNHKYPPMVCSTSFFMFIKGCGLGPWFVFVLPCFKENKVATCKIGSFLCSLDNLLQKNVSVLFFWKSNFKMALI